MRERDPDLLVTFRRETNERLDSIDATLASVGAGPIAPEVLESLSRDLHTIKGAAAMVGVDDVRTLSLELEDAVAAAREHPSLAPELVPRLRSAVAALRDHVADDRPSPPREESR